MAVEISKLMNLGDGLELYDDLRERTEAKYSKPLSGIPASDLAPNVIPDISGKADKTDVTDLVVVQDATPTGDTTRIWLTATPPNGIQVPTYTEFQALETTVGGKVSDVQVNSTTVVNNGVANIPVASTNIFGVVKLDSAAYGIEISEGKLRTSPAQSAHIKAGTNVYRPITTDKEHEATFYGLAKAAGDSTQAASENAVGTYTTGAKSAIQSMLGVPGDVQVNGTSVVSNGVANIPICSSSTFGVVKIDANSFGIKINDAGRLYIDAPNLNEMKVGTQAYKPITSSTQHVSVFYGLAKAAGDTTQKASSNAVGVYTPAAQAAIQTMLGVESAVSLVETVSGTTPSITCQPNVQYICGEVSTISITPPANGTCDVIFESGSTAAVLTLPNTVKMPAWFDSTSLETDTIYEIVITNGVYGSVMTWES